MRRETVEGTLWRFLSTAWLYSVKNRALFCSCPEDLSEGEFKRRDCLVWWRKFQDSIESRLWRGYGLLLIQGERGRWGDAACEAER